MPTFDLYPADLESSARGDAFLRQTDASVLRQMQEDGQPWREKVRFIHQFHDKRIQWLANCHKR